MPHSIYFPDPDPLKKSQPTIVNVNVDMSKLFDFMEKIKQEDSKEIEPTETLPQNGKQDVIKLLSSLNNS